MSNFEIFDYPATNKLIALIAPLLIIGVYLILFLIPLFSRVVSVEPTRYLLISAMAAPLALAFAAAIHLMYPEVHVSGDQFKIKSRFYESPWFRWEQIRQVNLPESRLVTQIVAVAVPQLPLIYWVVGLSQGVWGAAFLIHPKMRQGSRLVRKIYQKRRDLFPPETTKPTPGQTSE